jgi:amidase
MLQTVMFDSFMRVLFVNPGHPQAYLARISEVNPTLFAVTEINPDASCIAQQLDQERQAGVVRRYVDLISRLTMASTSRMAIPKSVHADWFRSPLHGIPILLKNNIATLDKMNNTGRS